jgi:hypothetical protein
VIGAAAAGVETEIDEAFGCAAAAISSACEAAAKMIGAATTKKKARRFIRVPPAKSFEKI